jgi:hypothetical protein
MAAMECEPNQISCSCKARGLGCPLSSSRTQKWPEMDPVSLYEVGRPVEPATIFQWFCSSGRRSETLTVPVTDWSLGQPEIEKERGVTGSAEPTKITHSRMLLVFITPEP